MYSYSLGYSGPGNVASFADSVMGAWNFNYDTLNRLGSGAASSGRYAGLNVAWTYDGFDNRKGEALSGTTQTPVPISQTVAIDGNNRVVGASYDAAGNLLDDGTNQYKYDGEGRLCAVYRYQTPQSLTGYMYDALGSRLAKGTLTAFSCDAAGNGFRAARSPGAVVAGSNAACLPISRGGNL